MVFKNKHQMKVNQEILNREFAVNLIAAIYKMRASQKSYFKAKSRLKNDPIVRKILNESVALEKTVDDLINQVIIKNKEVTYELFEED